MIFNDSYQENILYPRDITLLRQPFAREIEELLPVPATVVFWLDGKVIGPGKSLSATKSKQITPLCKESVPKCKHGVLVIPLKTTVAERSAAVVYDIDADLLKKMSSEWLLQLQEKVHKRLEQCRLIFIDPETGFYNNRAARHLVQYRTDNGKTLTFFLIKTVFHRRSATGCLQRIYRIVHFLNAVAEGELFHFGQGVFGLLGEYRSRQQSLTFAHALLRRLKREGLLKVQIGFCRFQRGEQENAEQYIREAWQALAKAERRGPYSLCDASSLHETTDHPFALPARQAVSILQRKWRGLERFGLVLVHAGEEISCKQSIQGCMQQALIEKEVFVSATENQGFLFLPGQSNVAAQDRMEQIKKHLNLKLGENVCSLGAACWPCLKYTKTDTLRNCRKALMHGSFFGPGSSVFFDHLSLNVSGDYCFEEGDYLQAVREYRNGLRMHDGDINLMNSLGVAMAEMNRQRQAIECFKKVVEKKPDNYMALVNLGFGYQALGQELEAIDYLEKAEAVSFHSGEGGSELYLQLGKLYCQSGSYEKAIRILEKWQNEQEDKREFTAYRLLGEAYMENGNPSLAIPALQRALQLYPHNCDSMSMLGLLYVENDQGGDVGLSLCRKAISLDERNARSWFRLARALFYLGAFSDALEAAAGSVRLRRGYVAATLLLGRIHQAMGNRRRALSVLRRISAMKGCTDKQRKSAQTALSAMQET